MKKQLSKLRLEIGRETLRNLIDTNAGKVDISMVDEIAELCDEYALRYLIIQISTKYGLPVCKCAICSAGCNLEFEWPLFFQGAREYPFVSETPYPLDEKLRAIAAETMDAASSADLGSIGTLYEMISSERPYIDCAAPHHFRIDMQNKENRRMIGQFYTPPSVVKDCVDIAMGGDSASLMKRLKGALSGGVEPGCAHACGNVQDTPADFKVLDPACGTGNFLVGVLEYAKGLAGSVSGDYWPDHPCDAYALARDCLFGYELDPRAASLARISICLAAFRGDHVQKRLAGACPARLISDIFQSLRRNIRVSDTLFAGAGVKESETEFDLVITNPPYVSFGARNQPVLPEASSRFLRHSYPASAEYKIRYHSIFQEIALRYARRDGHVLLLVPDGFLTGSYYERLRGALIEKARIASLNELPPDTIPDAVVGRWCVAHYVKSDWQDDYLVDVCSFLQPKGTGPASSVQQGGHLRFQLPLSILVAPDRRRFRLVFDERDRRLVEIIDRLDNLSSVVRGHTGIRSKLGKKAVVSEWKKGESWRPGIISGAEVRPYRVSWGGSYINVEAAILFGGGFAGDVIDRPKILVRQTGDRIIAALDGKRFHHLNNVHSFSPAAGFHERLNGGDGDCGSFLYFVLALMNSTLWRHIYRLKTREEGRALAQVDIETVETMPLPGAKMEETALLSRLARRAEENAHYEKEPDLLSFTQRSIDSIVYRLYGLDADLISHVHYRDSQGLPNRPIVQSTGAGEHRLPESDEIDGYLARFDS